jgi:hypothetical protein
MRSATVLRGVESPDVVVVIVGDQQVVQRCRRAGAEILNILGDPLAGGTQGIRAGRTQLEARSIRYRAGIDEKSGPVGKNQECRVTAARLDLMNIEGTRRPWVKCLARMLLCEAGTGADECEQASK